ncbi:MAG: lipoate--protein ligase family protein [Candidatus Heimdallarchaeota archaeon]|nr:lipoate--protein ligase family protein [Candidatus Heimdallarchaeota archaeon]
MKFRIIQSENHNVFNNLAIDHAVIQNSTKFVNDPIIRIWKNRKSIIMGRGQDIIKEVNQEFCRNHGIEIARRISGGGTVYQDLGNINLSFFLSPKIKKMLKISDLPSISKMLTTILTQSLESMGYKDLVINRESNILYKNKKISGSAGYIHKRWNLHHATILANVDLHLLEGSILARNHDPEDKKESRYFETINLPDFNMKKWMKSLFELLLDEYGIEVYFDKLNQDEESISQQLLKDLYLQKAWINDSKRNM